MVKVFRKMPKNAFFRLFFKTLPVAPKILPKRGLFSALGKLEKTSLVDLNIKGQQNFRKLSKNPPTDPSRNS